MYWGRVCALQCRFPWKPKTPNFLKLELRVALSQLKWVLGTKLHFSARAVFALNFWVISLVFGSELSLFPVIHYKGKIQIIAFITEDCTRCSLTQGFLQGHDPSVGRDLALSDWHLAMSRSTETRFANTELRIWDTEKKGGGSESTLWDPWVHVCKTENSWGLSKVTPPSF